MHPQWRGKGGEGRGLFLGEGIRGVIPLFFPPSQRLSAHVCDTVFDLPLQAFPNRHGQ